MSRIVSGFVTLVLIGCSVGTLLAQDAPSQSDDRQLFGVWDLVSIEDRGPQGELSLWLGQHLTGTITYSPNGRMVIQFMRDPRPVIATPNAWQGRQINPVNPAVPIGKLQDALGGYYAYFGIYTSTWGSSSRPDATRSCVRSIGAA